MTLRLTNHPPGYRGPVLPPDSLAHAHASFIRAITTYGVDSRDAEIAYRRYQRALHPDRRKAWNPDDWREQARERRERPR